MDTGYIREQCRKLNEQMVAWRRQLHRIPETGMNLPETEAAVRGFLKEMGIGLQENYRGVGVVGLLRGEAGDGPTLGIRADMDALEIEEEPGRRYGSLHPGKMHACGHDAHMAIALGAAHFLASHKGEWGGALKLIFQPAEETMGGAKRMIEQGALENPRVDALLGLHIGGIWEEVGTGQIGVSPRPIMASADAFDFSIRSQGGHGAQPQKSPDPVLAAAQTINLLHTLISRELDPVDPAVIAIGRISGGHARNIIPVEVKASGTLRTLSQQVREHLKARIAEVVAHTAEAYRCGHQFDFQYGTPPVVSDPALCELVEEAARDLFGPSGVRKIERPAMVGEDVSLFLNEVPGCFFALGGSNPEKGIHSLHHCPVFDIDESVLWKGAALFSLCALRFAKGKVAAG